MLWGDLPTEILFLAAVSALFAAIVAFFLDWWRPSMHPRRIAVVSSLIFPSLIFILVLIGSALFLSEDCPPGSVCDAGAMAFVGLVMIGGMTMAIALPVGFLSGHLAIRYLRSK
jgi:hypothetical protein